jgi:predicted kinase
MELVLLIGLQGSGKTTFARTRFAGTHVLISRDCLLNNRQPARRERQLVAEALAAGRSVIVDDTNPTPEVRAPLIELGRTHGAEVSGYFFEPDLEACLLRNRQRPGKQRVPDVALFATLKRLTPPSFAEGFDRLFSVRTLAGLDFQIREWKRKEESRGR